MLLGIVITTAIICPHTSQVEFAEAIAQPAKCRHLDCILFLEHLLNHAGLLHKSQISAASVSAHMSSYELAAQLDDGARLADGLVRKTEEASRESLRAPPPPPRSPRALPRRRRCRRRRGPSPGSHFVVLLFLLLLFHVVPGLLLLFHVVASNPSSRTGW